jgi:asparagine synthase (glutamine-hydrolysing)
MSMAHSIESRVPFLDRKVYELAKNIPLSEKVTDRNTKVCFREAAHRYLSEAQAKKKKLGFPVPIRVWLRTDKYYNIVKKEFTGKTAAKFFHTDELVKILDKHKCGKEDYARHIWVVYMFLLWYKQYFTEDGCSVTIEDELRFEKVRKNNRSATMNNA